ncbi:MAG: hypothetical protein KAT04_04905 [Methylococcales bacterium]|nr:hypothetical protein [Methylococcales bacterium]
MSIKNNTGTYIVFTGLIFFMTAGITVANKTLSIMGMDTNKLLWALVAIIVVGLMTHAELFFIVLILGLTIAINSPPGFIFELGISPDILLSTLIAIVLLPLITRIFK